MKRRELLQSLAAFAGTAATSNAWGGMIPEAAKTPASRDAFFWGAATAGHQVEGNCVNDDAWALEQLSPSIFKEPSRDSCDQYHLFAQDIAMMAEWGLTAYRFSVEWSRVEPAKGEFSQAELSHYRQVLECCHRYKLLPLVTYNHAATPRWFAMDGGWEQADAPELFARYCRKVTASLGDLIGYAATLNEPNLQMLFNWVPVGDGTLSDFSHGKLPEIRRQLKSETFSSYFACDPERVAAASLRAHQLGRQAIRSVRADLPVGLTLAMEDDQAAGEDSRAALKRQQCYEPWLALAKQDEYIGVQTYTRQRIGRYNLPPPAGAKLTQMGYEFYPEALEHTIRYAAERTGRPVIVTENGVASENDEDRIEYIRRAISGMRRCMADGIEVKGYMYWSLLDNFEWIFGYTPRFGLVAVDHATQTRTVKPSAKFLASYAKKS